MKLTTWLKEREMNARRIASSKTGDDRDGWLEDADYFKAAHEALGAPMLVLGSTAIQIEAAIDLAHELSGPLHERIKALVEKAAVAQCGPVHFRAVLDTAQVSQQLNTCMHVAGFRNLKAAEQFAAEQLDFYGWRYTIEPLYAAPVTQAKPEQAAQPMTPEQRRVLINEAGDKTDGLNQDDFAAEIVRSVEKFHNITKNGFDSVRQPSEVEKFMDAAGLCRRCAAATQQAADEVAVIQRLLDLARQVDHALDDSEEVDCDGYRSHNIAGQDFDDVVEALDALEDLPDDKPGMTLGPAGKAEWALRRLLPNTGDQR